MLLGYDYYALNNALARILKSYENDNREKALLQKITDMFDITGLSSLELYIFLINNEEDSKDNGFSISYCLSILQGLLIQHTRNENISLDLFWGIKYDEFSRKFNEISEYKNFYRKCVKFVLFYTIFLENKNSQYEQESEDEMKYFDVMSSWANKGQAYFRGQSDYSWNLVPSIIRGFCEKNKYSGTLIDSNKLFNLYDDADMVTKYNKVFEANIKNGNDINYNFLSFMQHSISYSPLIDFTKDYKTACSFAITKNSINSYLQKDSSVYILDAESMDEDFIVNDNDIVKVDKIIKNLNIRLFNKKIKPGTKMYVDGVFGPREVDFTTVKKIKDNLTPKFVIIKTMTNDRMKYQKGCFVLFYDYVSVNGNVLYELVRELTVFKHKIRIADKKLILNKIDGYYNQSDLLNPYQVFNDNKM